jgi:predicted ribosomally synthesized peptide with nif11-like leader
MMSLISARLFLKRFKEDEAFRRILENASDDSARRDIRNLDGFDFTREEIQLVMNEPRELDTEELEAVAGGGDTDPSSSGSPEGAAAAAV